MSEETKAEAVLNLTAQKLTERFGEEVLEVIDFKGETTAVCKKGQLQDILTFLRDDTDLAYDRLTDLTAVDYSEYPGSEQDARFNVVYHLYSHPHNKRFRVRALVDEETCSIDSACPVWKGAEWPEREVFDMFGLQFKGHPDLRRILMPVNFRDYPLRKDYPLHGRGERDVIAPEDPGFEGNPFFDRDDGGNKDPLASERMVLNLGPQHPATHGTLRVIVKLDGERVTAAEPVMGYMHRGYEKLAEVRTYPQITTLVNRIDWLGSFANEVPFILAAERLMEVEAPPRAQWIRTVLFELSRIANVVLFLGDMGVQLGAVTPVFFAFRDREFVLNQIEAVTGGRFHPNFDRIGGLKDDIPKGWVDETRGVLDRIRTFCDEMEDLVTGNEIFQARTRGIGVIPADVGLSYGLSGANIRASGVDWDLRRDGGVGLVHDRLDWKVWTHPDGDSFSRYWVRLQEVREACIMVDQLLDGMPSGPIMAKVPRIIKVPAGEAYVETENPLGIMGFYVISKGDLVPYRVKIRSASFNNISITPWLLKGVYVPDVVSILASLYFILGDIDR